jgi:hypothetical protein
MAMSGDYDAASDRQFGGRIRRYAKVTSTMGGLAARVNAILVGKLIAVNMPLICDKHLVG